MTVAVGVPTKVYATAKLTVGDGPWDELGLFTVPQGQLMPGTVNSKLEILTAEHTNIVQAGQFGSTIGNFRMERAKATLSAPVDVNASVELRVAGRRIFDLSLSRLLDGLDLTASWDGKIGTGVIADAGDLLVAQNDTFEVRIKRFGPVEADVYLRVEFEGTAMQFESAPGVRAKRCSHCHGSGYV